MQRIWFSEVQTSYLTVVIALFKHRSDTFCVLLFLLELLLLFKLTLLDSVCDVCPLASLSYGAFTLFVLRDPKLFLAPMAS